MFYPEVRDSRPREMMSYSKYQWKYCFFLQTILRSSLSQVWKAVWTQERLKNVFLFKSVLCVEPYQGCIINAGLDIHPDLFLLNFVTHVMSFSTACESIKHMYTCTHSIMQFPLRDFPSKEADTMYIRQLEACAVYYRSPYGLSLRFWNRGVTKNNNVVFFYSFIMSLGAWVL